MESQITPALTKPTALFCRSLLNVLCGGGFAYLQGHRSTHHQTQQKRLLVLARLSAALPPGRRRGSQPQPGYWGSPRVQYFKLRILESVKETGTVHIL